MKFKELLAQAGFQTGGGLKSLAAGAALAWSMQTAQKTATDAAETALVAENRLEIAVAAFEEVKRLQADTLNGMNAFLADQIREGLYDNAVEARVRYLGWKPPVFDEFEEFAEAVAPTGVTPSDVDSERLAECGEPYPCEHAPDGGNHPQAAH